MGCDRHRIRGPSWLYETNYAGNHEDIRIQALWHARGSGALDGMIALAEQCLSDYDENGWRNPVWLNADDVGPSWDQRHSGGIRGSD
jgi:4-hydroxyphenylacetate 3-monooxygenase